MNPPMWLCAEGVSEWERVLEVLGGRAVDPVMLGAYCQAYGRWRQAEALLEENGTEIILRNDKGEVRSVTPSPQVGISAKAYAQMLKAAESLGLVAGRGRGGSGKGPSARAAGRVITKGRN